MKTTKITRNYRFFFIDIEFLKAQMNSQICAYFSEKIVTEVNNEGLIHEVLTISRSYSLTIS